MSVIYIFHDVSLEVFFDVLRHLVTYGHALGDPQSDKLNRNTSSFYDHKVRSVRRNLFFVCLCITYNHLIKVQVPKIKRDFFNFVKNVTMYS